MFFCVFLWIIRDSEGILNAAELRAQLQDDGVHFRGTNDSEVIARLIAHQREASLEDAVAKAMTLIEGAYALPGCQSRAGTVCRSRPARWSRRSGWWWGRRPAASQTRTANTI